MSTTTCEECARVTDCGEGRILIAMTVGELVELACAVTGSLRARLFTAAALLDPELVAWTKADLETP